MIIKCPTSLYDLHCTVAIKQCKRDEEALRRLCNLLRHLSDSFLDYWHASHTASSATCNLTPALMDVETTVCSGTLAASICSF